MKQRLLITDKEEPSNFTSEYQKNPKTLIQKDICIPMFIAALFTIVKKWKQPKCPSIDEWIKKKCYIIQWNITHRKEWNLAICYNMDGTRGHYAKWNKSDRGRQTPFDFTYMWNLKNKTKQMNKWNRNNLISTEKILIVARWEGGRWMGQKGEGIKMCKLPVIKIFMG